MRVLTLLLAMLIFGCATLESPPVGERFTSFSAGVDEAATVYIFRNASTLSLGGLTQIFVDGEEVARIDNRGFTRFMFAPGCYELTHAWPGQMSLDARPLRLCVEAGAVEVIRVRPDSGTYRTTVVGGGVYGSGRFQSFLELVERADALGKNPITACRFYPPMGSQAGVAAAN